MALGVPMENYYEHVIVRGMSASHRGVDIGWQLVDINGNPINQYRIEKLLAVENGVCVAEGFGKNVYGAWIDNELRAGRISPTTAEAYRNEIICWIQLDNGWIAKYGHCAETYVSKGERVTKGQLVALMGSTGNSDGNHLHFELNINGTYVDFRPYLEPRVSVVAQGSIGTPTELPEGFNETAYLFLNPDVASAVQKGTFPSGANHYIRFGKSENRLYKQSDMDRVKELENLLNAKEEEKNQIIAQKNQEFSQYRQQILSELDQIKLAKENEVRATYDGQIVNLKEQLRLANEKIVALQTPQDEESEESVSEWEQKYNELVEDSRLEREEVKKTVQALQDTIKVKDSELQQKNEEIVAINNSSILPHDLQVVLKENPVLLDIAKGKVKPQAKHFTAPFWFMVQKLKENKPIVYKFLVATIGTANAVLWFPYLEPFLNTLPTELSYEALIGWFMVNIGTVVGIAEVGFLKNKNKILVLQILTPIAVSIWQHWEETHKKQKELEKLQKKEIKADDIKVEAAPSPFLQSLSN